MAERRALKFSSYDQLLTDLDRLSEDYSKVGRWSLGQIAEHLRITMNGSLDPTTKRLPAPLRFILRHTMLRWLLKHNRMPAGVKAPKSIQPPPAVDDDAAVSRLRETIVLVRDHPREHYLNPAFGRMTRARWDHLQLIHAAHHLSFLIPADAAPTPRP